MTNITAPCKHTRVLVWTWCKTSAFYKQNVWMLSCVYTVIQILSIPFAVFFLFFFNWARPVLTACLLTKRCTNKECALESWRTAANPRPRHPLLIPTLTTSGWSSFCLYGAPYMRRNDCRMETNLNAMFGEEGEKKSQRKSLINKTLRTRARDVEEELAVEMTNNLSLTSCR